MAFRDFPAKSWDELLPHAPSLARDLVSKLIVYESGQRLSAEEASTKMRGGIALLTA